ncbi:acyl-CoA dehydrogenase family protein [Cryobacterium psychrophilum]|uniref:Acyl-CoA dehydrogenase n=1 Tax=Cryobacterium psychrophilum TaxID=41988 RepID=A0A4Y8KL52_9MICO|nr:acyl-CoA dehydrogenase family protein [Cryobacterium psychrophilum]TDW28828.1 alkylation response protein AidB-like acyl-CoA dehydrogenase [Cryobacterium psychrophilum]TFD76201.1 acyl-CoA dehydrogenase [Cryobacterium psychrophilum]
MDFSESSEHAALRSAVASIVSPFGGRYYAEHAKNREPCQEVWLALGAAGFVGVNIDEEYGGGGGGMLDLALVCEESAAQGVPLLLMLVSAAISAEVISEFGTVEQKSTWLPGLADGTSKVVFAITEPDAGSNTHRITTTATKDGDDWVLTGSKYYISGVDEADALLVVARTGRNEKGGALMSLFIVPTDAPGLERTPINMDVMLPEKQFTLFFDDVRLGADSLVGVENNGFQQVFHGLNPERITGAALCIGIARYALAQAARYASEREVWGVPIGTHQGLSHPLAQASMETELAALMMRKAAWLHDNGLPAGEASNTAKYAAAEAAVSAIDAAIQTHGGNGLTSEYGLLPYWGLARLLKIAPVSREMILNYIAQHSLGLPRSY